MQMKHKKNVKPQSDTTYVRNLAYWKLKQVDQTLLVNRRLLLPLLEFINDAVIKQQCFSPHIAFFIYFFFLSKELFFLYRPTDSFAEHLLWSFVSNSICITKINFTSDYWLTPRKWQSSSFQCLFMPLFHLCMGDT